jgi:hypothetical protein
VCLTQGRAILLRDIEERSAEETAQILGASISAVKARVFQGRRKLRATVGPGLLSKSTRPIAPRRSAVDSGFVATSILADTPVRQTLTSWTLSLRHACSTRDIDQSFPPAAS